MLRQASRDAAQTASLAQLTNQRKANKVVCTFSNTQSAQPVRGLNKESALGNAFSQSLFLPVCSLRACCFVADQRLRSLSRRNLDRRRARFWFRALALSRTWKWTSFSIRKTRRFVVTNGEEQFHETAIYALRGAHPGQHWVTALERNDERYSGAILSSYQLESVSL
jgi:hypothetical protein